ncbi:MAG: DUF1232 domain-containing protein [Chthoniobacterales bacterium]
MSAVGLLSAAYLANIGAGFFEFLPDNLPVVGNIDEALATFLLLNSLAYFGINLRSNLKHDKNESNPGGSTAGHVNPPSNPEP